MIAPAADRIASKGGLRRRGASVMPVRTGASPARSRLAAGRDAHDIDACVRRGGEKHPP
jgi:hypothetical protein